MSKQKVDKTKKEIYFLRKGLLFTFHFLRQTNNKKKTLLFIYLFVYVFFLTSKKQSRSYSTRNVVESKRSKGKKKNYNLSDEINKDKIR